MSFPMGTVGKEEKEMTRFSHTTRDTVEITRNRVWGYDTVRRACIRNDLYTRGDCEAYDKMLAFVEKTEPTTKAVYTVAKDIAAHSKDQPVTNVMYILESEAIITTFLIDGKDDI